jgi:hypothetical protein
MRKPRLKSVHGVRGRSVEVPATPTAPVISKIDGGHFSIYWPGIKPFEWAVQTQGEPDGEIDFWNAFPGNQSVIEVTGSPYAVKVVGRDADHNPVTDVSSILILNPPPFVAPHNIVATYDPGPDALSWTYEGSQPDGWQVQFSQDGGATWAEDQTVAGNDTNVAPNHEPASARVVAIQDGSQAGETSNTVDVG